MKSWKLCETPSSRSSRIPAEVEEGEVDRTHRRFFKNLIFQFHNQYVLKVEGCRAVSSQLRHSYFPESLGCSGASVTAVVLLRIYEQVPSYPKTVLETRNCVKQARSCMTLPDNPSWHLTLCIFKLKPPFEGYRGNKGVTVAYNPLKHMLNRPSSSAAWHMTKCSCLRGCLTRSMLDNILPSKMREHVIINALKEVRWQK